MMVKPILGVQIYYFLLNQSKKVFYSMDFTLKKYPALTVSVFSGIGYVLSLSKIAIWIGNPRLIKILLLEKKNK